VGAGERLGSGGHVAPLVSTFGLGRTPDLEVMRETDIVRKVLEGRGKGI